MWADPSSDPGCALCPGWNHPVQSRFHWKKGGIQRPRVRKIGSWKTIKDDDSMINSAMRATLYEVSTRNIGKLSARDLASMSKSQVSRLWQKKIYQLAEEPQNRDLNGLKLLANMVGGVGLAKDQVVTVALGILEDGSKKFPGYQSG